MIPVPHQSTVAIPPPAYQRAQAKAQPPLHLDALTLVTRLHLLALCRIAVRLAHWRCPPPLPAGPGGQPRVYTEESLLLIALLQTLWRLSYQDMSDWLRSWSALALACGLPLTAQGQPPRAARGEPVTGAFSRPGSHLLNARWREADQAVLGIWRPFGVPPECHAH